ncbi:uncharacterized protein ASCRUDRAFT_81131 [Ascoidea rubescens DSM 1968]|uniref:Zn(2)-C6 fungal-type domain-containing protein n=1 Tax=Ascoidea rubescens DSM 1968 TaxID=1344418 RepID=A0A1D2VGH0_9ASCO|nr:hypothetical protein ASCRUDRAFT_81131 [Ascoidea rubescens DSM 1968]ODV60758.1 hypothetical protein ASCRUDRAFT_81131 [Ascoidea rubescens DSM 1968]
MHRGHGLSPRANLATYFHLISGAEQQKSLEHHRQMNHTTNDSDDAQQFKRRRVSKACDFCRRRKVKCNGENPCINCFKNNFVCNYSLSRRKKSTVLLLNNDIYNGEQQVISENPREKLPLGSQGFEHNQISLLTDRLDKMETLMQNITDKLSTFKEDLKDGNADKKYNANTNLNTNSNANDSKKKTNRFNFPVLEHENTSELSLNSPNKYSPFIPELRPNEFIGPQTNFSIFSAKGMQWLRENLGSDAKEYLDPLMKLPKTIHKVVKSQIKKWREPISSVELTPLPDKYITDALLELFLGENSPIPIPLLKHKEMKALFDQYYQEQAGIYSKNKLNYSDFLLMNVVVTASSSLLIDAKNVDENFIKFLKLPDIPISKLKELENKHLLNSIYYFNRISIVPDGIRSIHGILLLAMYNEITFSHKISYMLLSIAIRLSQDMGLHRAETYTGYSEAEAFTRRITWLVCYQYDKAVCFRTGKPPIVNDADVSFKLDLDFTLAISKFYQIDASQLTDFQISSYFNVLYNSDNTDVGRGFLFIMVLLGKIGIKSYFKLFSASALVGKSQDEIVEIVGSLLQELDDFQKILPPRIQIGNNILKNLFNSTENEYINSHTKMFTVFVHFVYYNLVIRVNKIAMRDPWSTNLTASTKPDQPTSSSSSGNTKKFNDNEFCNRCLDAARQVLKLCWGLPQRVNHLLSLCLFFPSNALILLFGSVVQHPTSESAADDLNLMIQAYMKFFAVCPEKAKFQMVDLAVRQLIKIAIKIYEKNNGDKPFEICDEVKGDLNRPAQVIDRLIEERKQRALSSFQQERPNINANNNTKKSTNISAMNSNARSVSLTNDANTTIDNNNISNNNLNGNTNHNLNNNFNGAFNNSNGNFNNNNLNSENINDNNFNTGGQGFFMPNINELNEYKNEVGSTTSTSNFDEQYFDFNNKTSTEVFALFDSLFCLPDFIINKDIN